MTRLVRIAGIYNASAIVVLVTPGALGLVDVQEPYSDFWRWLPGLDEAQWPLPGCPLALTALYFSGSYQERERYGDER